MKSQLTVVGLGGSLAKHSSSLAALKIALQGAEEAGAKTALLDIRQLSPPMYDSADENPPDSVREMCDAVYQADGLIWSSPMYNGTISGSFKNALDWLKLLGDRNRLTEQLHALGREVARGSCQFALQPPTKVDAAKAETEITPLSDEEAKTA